MSPKSLLALDLRTRPRWRAWLEMHHATSPGIWLVFHKRHTSAKTLSYGEAVEGALCFGWIDSILKRLEDDRYARKFAPPGPAACGRP